MIEEEKTPEKRMAAIKEGAISALMPLFEASGAGEILRDAALFREEAGNLNPWANVNFEGKAKEIHGEYSGTPEWGLFCLAYRFVRIATSDREPE